MEPDMSGNTVWHRTLNKLQRVGLGWYYRAHALQQGSWISLGASLDVMPGGKLVIGRGVRVLTGSHINIHEGAVLSLGDRAWVGPSNIIYCAERIHIGADTRVSHFCSIIDHNYAFRPTGNYFDLPKKSAPIEIGDFSWLGAGSTLLKGAELGSHCVVGANTLLRAGRISAGTVCARRADNATNTNQTAAAAVESQR